MFPLQALKAEDSEGTAGPRLLHLTRKRKMDNPIYAETPPAKYRG